MGTAQAGKLPAARRHSPKRGRHSGAPTLRKHWPPCPPRGQGVCAGWLSVLLTWQLGAWEGVGRTPGLDLVGRCPEPKAPLQDREQAEGLPQLGQASLPSPAGPGAPPAAWGVAAQLGPGL